MSRTKARDRSAQASSVSVDKSIPRVSGPEPTEAAIRAALRLQLRTLVQVEDSHRLVEELGIDHGKCRIDVALVDRFLFGFEIKGPQDTLGRLERQVSYYDRVLDFSCLVTVERHLERALRELPIHWGIFTVIPTGPEFRIAPVRTPTKNPHTDAFTVAQLLWRDEALDCLVARGIDRGVRTKPAAAIHARLAKELSFDELREIVTEQLRVRTCWPRSHSTLLNSPEAALSN